MKKDLTLILLLIVILLFAARISYANDLSSRTNYNHYWMKYLPSNYIDYTAANEFQYSEENQYGWDNNAWVEVYSYEYSYSNGFLTGMYTTYGAMQAQSTVTYDANSRIHQITLGLFNGTSYDDYMRETFDYNDNGILSSYLKEMNSAGGWTNSEQCVITLEGDHTNSFVDQDWDADIQSWVNDDQFTLTWVGDVVTEVLRENWEVDHWDNSMLYGYTYMDDLLSESLSQYWNGSIWINSNTKLFTWEDGHIAIELRQGWNGSTWINELNQTYSYDEFDRPLELMGTVWENDLWENDHWIEYIYSTGNSNNSIPYVSLELNNYPNPFNPETTIEFNIAEGNSGTLEIFNLKGQIIHSKEFNSRDHKYVWDAAEQPSGIYFYKVTAGDYSKTNKMILMK